MDSATLTALQKSIQKWESITNDGGLDRGTENCALCAMFVNRGSGVSQALDEYDCHGCPVAKATRNIMCDGSPYQDWAAYQQSHEKISPSSVFDAGSKRIAQAELDFLKSLLPKESTDAT